MCKLYACYLDALTRLPWCEMATWLPFHWSKFDQNVSCSCKVVTAQSLSWNCACASPRSPPRNGSLWVIFTVTDDVTWSHMCQCLVKEAGAMQGGTWMLTWGQKVRFHVFFPSNVTSWYHFWCHRVIDDVILCPVTWTWCNIHVT